MINNSLYSSAKSNWATPQDFFDALDAEFHFDLDPCADEHNHKCARYFTEEDDGLVQPWGAAVSFAIRLMAAQSRHGSKRHMKKAGKKTLWLRF